MGGWYIGEEQFASQAEMDENKGADIFADWSVSLRVHVPAWARTPREGTTVAPLHECERLQRFAACCGTWLLVTDCVGYDVEPLVWRRQLLGLGDGREGPGALIRDGVLLVESAAVGRGVRERDAELPCERGGLLVGTERVAAAEVVVPLCARWWWWH